MFASTSVLLALLAIAPDSAAPRVDYRIEARLDEDAQVLRGRALVRYENRSGHTLDSLYFQQHLNAFRPNSAWARREAGYGQMRFQELGPDEHAFERLRAVRIDGRSVAATYPYAPDSTIFSVPLARPLASGAAVEVQIDWDARPSTVPRRQGRSGRQFDFAQWYPRIAVFEEGAWQLQPLLPQGEFYGEFASYDVTLDVAADQILAATGVPVAGDPGWAAVNAGTSEPQLRRDAYAPKPAVALGHLTGGAATGRKRVRWRAEDVHHFAWNTSPDFIYEGGAWRSTPLHVLYLETDTLWDDGVELGYLRESLDWLANTFAPYPYPQLTASRRVERSGATEFPMLMMNSSGSRGQVMHETVHMYAHAILASNEWAEAWLDEGMAEFLTRWFWEDVGQPQWQAVIDTMAARERAGATQEIATPAAEFRDPRTYSQMSYARTALVLRMLREYLGADVMREVLRSYYRDNAFSHVEESDFRRAAETVSGQDLDWFFDQWLHEQANVDYAIGEVSWGRVLGGGYRVRIEVVRNGDAWMPVTLRAGEHAEVLDAREPRRFVVLELAELPAEIVLDPERILIDPEPGNNSRLLDADTDAQ